MSATAIRQQFEDAMAAPEARQISALERFERLGLPDRRLEHWRYTDLSSLARVDFRFVPPVPDEASIDGAREVIADIGLIDGHGRLVFVDGHWIESLSGIPDDSGVEVTVKRLPDTESEDAETALVALNAAFAARGVHLRFSRAETTPVELVSIGSGQQLAPQFPLRIELTAGAKGTLIQHFADLPGADQAWLNIVTDIDQGENSQLTLHRLQAHSRNTVQTTLVRARLQRGAALEAGNIELGAAVVRNEYEVALEGPKASASLFGLAITRDDQHCDARIAVDHRAPETTSRQNYRAIVDDSSKSIFNGKVTVQEQAQNIDARQRNDNLLLSRKAEVDTKPELEIYADQVVCSHGATVGELDEDHLFYLRSRGVDAETARGILTTAFADAVLEQIGHEPFRERARAAVRRSLPATL